MGRFPLHECCPTVVAALGFLTGLCCQLHQTQLSDLSPEEVDWKEASQESVRLFNALLELMCAADSLQAQGCARALPLELMAMEEFIRPLFRLFIICSILCPCIPIKGVGGFQSGLGARDVNGEHTIYCFLKDDFGSWKGWEMGARQRPG